MAVFAISSASRRKSSFLPAKKIACTSNSPFANSRTEITGVGFIRAKESDRLGDLVGELVKCGVDATELEDGLRIEPGFVAGAAVDTHHDHRLAMAFGVMGLRLNGMRIHDPDVVSKSWPQYWTMLESLRVAP